MSLSRTLSSPPLLPRTSRAERRVITTLWTPPHRRLALALASVLQRLSRAWARAAQRRGKARAARLAQQALAQLDWRTLRDIGLGDWAPSARDTEAAQLHRELTLRGL